MLLNKSVKPQFTSSNFAEKGKNEKKFLSIKHHIFVILVLMFSFESVIVDCLSQQVTHSDPVISTFSTSTKTSGPVGSSHQTILPLYQTEIPLSSPTVPTNIKTQSESLNSSFNNQLNSSYERSHSYTFAGMYLRSIKLKTFISFYITDIFFSTFHLLHSYFSEQVFVEIKKMREQIKEIHGILKQCNTLSGVSSIPDNCPIEFPLKTRESLQLLENYLSFRENQNTMV